ncbi:MAG: rod shape-determining protein RodA [Saprospiraceae bacterium]|nr:rod shape-determining protein RodA [Saprospiraceae bacterium]
MSINKAISRQGFDWITFGVYLILVIIGSLSLFSVEFNDDNKYQFFDISGPHGKYLVIVVFSILLFYMAYLMEWRFWSSFALPIYLFSIFLLIAVLIFGSEIKGSRSWFNISGFSFKPSEFAKLGTAFAISAFFSQFKRDLNNPKVIFQALGIVFLPVLLILFQPDAGSALIFMSVFLLFYKIGLPPFIYLIGAILTMTFILTLMYHPDLVILGALSIAIIIYAFIFLENKWIIIASFIIAGLSFYLFHFFYGFIVIPVLFTLLLGSAVYYFLKKGIKSVLLLPITIIAIMLLSFGTEFVFNNILKPHQQDRINVWLNPEKCDPRGSLYNILQSKTAIGSGGLFGKGYLEGNMTHLNYVPEQSTDFIFSAIGEEHGFIGIALIVFLFTVLLFRIIAIGEKGKTTFITYFAYTIAGFIFIHFVMNIGMNMGILPVIGIPLPFISKGGSSIMIFSIMIGILLKMDSERNVR